MKNTIDNKIPNPAKARDDAWTTQGKEYWQYEEGKRAKMPLAVEAFYASIKTGTRDVLDVGCGTGRFLIPFAQDGLTVVGLEPSRGMRDGAESNMRKAGIGALLVNGDSTNLSSFTNENFDLVFSKGAIHHNMWSGIQKSFREVARVLKSGKFFIFQGRSTKDSSLANAERIQDTGITAKDKKGWKKGVAQHYFTREELEQLAKENGFEIVVEPEEIVKEDGRARWWVVYRKI